MYAGDEDRRDWWCTFCCSFCCDLPGLAWSLTFINTSNGRDGAFTGFGFSALVASISAAVCACIAGQYYAIPTPFRPALVNSQQACDQAGGVWVPRSQEGDAVTWMPEAALVVVQRNELVSKALVPQQPQTHLCTCPPLSVQGVSNGLLVCGSAVEMLWTTAVLAFLCFLVMRYIRKNYSNVRQPGSYAMRPTNPPASAQYPPPV